MRVDGVDVDPGTGGALRGRSSRNGVRKGTCIIRKASAVGLVVLGLLSAPATGHEEGLVAGDGLIYHNCHELLGFQKAPKDTVSDVLPEAKDYGLDPDGDGGVPYAV